MVDELRHLRDEFGFDEFYFCDETFSLDMELAADLCRAIIADVPESDGAVSRESTALTMTWQN